MNRKPLMGLFLLNMKVMKRIIEFSNSKLTPEKAKQMLRSEGLEVTIEQASEICFS